MSYSAIAHARVSLGLVAFLLVGCAEVARMQGKGPASPPPAVATSSAAADDASSPSADDMPSPSAKERFAVCAAKFDAAYAKWKASDEKTKKVIEASANDGFYAGYGKVVAQFNENCKTARMLSRDASEEERSALKFWTGSDAGTGLELALAATQLQVRNGMYLDTPLTGTSSRDRIWEFAKKAPLTGDAAFDRNEYCGGGAYNATLRWLPKAERVAFLAKRKELLARAQALLTKVVAGLDNTRLKSHADRGRVKAVKKLADGTLEVSVKNLYGGAVCQHTGNWTFNGTFWSDCSYAAAQEKEIYPFTVRFASGQLPPTGVNVGDVIAVWGLRTPGANERDAADGARYDDPYVDSVLRAGKALWDAPISRLKCD